MSGNKPVWTLHSASGHKKEYNGLEVLVCASTLPGALKDQIDGVSNRSLPFVLRNGDVLSQIGAATENNYQVNHNAPLEAIKEDDEDFNQIVAGHTPTQRQNHSIDTRPSPNNNGSTTPFRRLLRGPSPLLTSQSERDFTPLA